MSGSEIPMAGLLLVIASLTQAQQQIPVPVTDDAEPTVRARLAELQQELQQQPDSAASAATWGLYGMTLEAHDFTAEARAAYRRAHELEPAEFRWPYLYASLLAQADPRSALRFYIEALELRPDYAPAHVRLGDAYEELGQVERATRHFREAARLDPDNPFGPMGLGRLALLDNDLDRAIEHLERSRRIDPDLKSLLVTLARAYQRAGRREEARQLAEQARSLPRINYRPDPVRAAVRDHALDSRGHLRRARSARERGDHRTARRELEAAVSIDPSLATAHFSLAQVLALDGEAAGAVESALRAQSLERDLPGVASFLASTLFGLERFSEARRQTLAALEQRPDDAHMLLTLSMLAVNDGDGNRAIALVQRAYESRPPDPQTRRLLRGLLEELAASFEEAGLHREAAARIEQLIVLATEDGESETVLETYRTRLRDLSDGR